MKKNIVLCLSICIFIGLNVTKANAESVLEPQWSEFCPPLYENATFIHAKENSKRNMENNYWALRRVKFEKSIAECKTLAQSQSELGACFARVANLEKNKNNQKIQAKNDKIQDTNLQIRDGGYWWY